MPVGLLFLSLCVLTVLTLAGLPLLRTGWSQRSVWSGAAMLILVGKVSSFLLFDVDGPFTPARGAVTLFQSTIGLVCVTALALAFYPPATYKRWIESRSHTTLAA